MDISVEPLDNPTPVNQTSTPASGGDMIQHLSLAKRFNIDIPTKEEDNKLREIWEHARGLSSTGDITDVMWQVIHLEQTIGAPSMGEPRLDKLYRYTKLRRQERQIQEELRHVSLGSNL